MAKKLLTLEEAAARLGISGDELVQLIDQRKIFGIKDGSAWKFKEDEIERYQLDREAGSSSGDEAFYLPVDDAESQDDAGLVTDELLGGSSIKSGSVIGPNGGDDASPSDSDLNLGDSDSNLLAGDSGVQLVPDDDLDSGGSGLRLVPSDSSGVGSDLKLVDLDSGSGGLGLKPDEDEAGSSKDLGATIEMQPGGDMTSGGSDLTISESGLALGDDDLESGLGSGKGSSAVGSSSLALGSGFDDDDLVLGGSSGGSGIGDSGINLEAANDSGLSLEEPLELGGDDGFAEGSDEMDMSSDDDFLLTPMLELDDQDSDSSGSQVIALDTEEDFDDQAATQLGSDATMPGQMLDPMAGGSPVGMDQMMVPAGPPEATHSGFTISFLVLCFLTLGLTGMMMFEMITDIWSWDGPSEASTAVMDGIIGLFE